MVGEGVQDNFLPQVATKDKESAENAIRIYSIVICLLLALAIILAFNNIAAYKRCLETRELLEEMYSKVSALAAAEAETDLEPALASENMEWISDNAAEIPEHEVLKESLNALARKNEEIIKQVQKLKKQNDELTIKNRELMEDNIELQNTLKKAAEAGIKPQNYTAFRGLSSRGELDRGIYLGKFLGTAYTPSEDECGNNKGITNSGKPIIPGVSVAIDKEYWPYGTVFYIRGLGYAVAMDTGSAIKGKYRFDFAVFDKEFAKKLGTRYWDVYLVKMGDGSIDEPIF